MIMSAKTQASNSTTVQTTTPLSVSQAIERYSAARAGGRGGSPRLSGITIEGRISRARYHNSGHIYLKITDDSSSLEAFVHRNETRKVPYTLEPGQRVEVRGVLSTYGPNQILQLRLHAISPFPKGATGVLVGVNGASTGSPALVAGGTDILVSAHRRALPEMPMTIGIVTAPGSAALGDALSVFQVRAPWVHVLFAPATTQGEGAAESIVGAIGRLVDRGCDAILLTRGGGGDGYAPYQDSRVARAIIDSPIPVVTAIGHAGDSTLACKVADLACETPTAGAHAITRGHAALLPGARPVYTAICEFKSALEVAVLQLQERLSPIETTLARLSEQASPLSVDHVLPRQ